MATVARTNVAGWSQGEAEPLEGKMAVDTNQEQGQIRMPFLQNQDFSGRWAPSVFPHGASKPHQEELQQLRDVGRTKVSGICFWLVLGSEATQLQAQIYLGWGWGTRLGHSPLLCQWECAL